MKCTLFSIWVVVFAISGMNYVDAQLTCFPTIDCGFNIDGCQSFCRDRNCSPYGSECRNNNLCCCLYCRFG
uniref:PVFP-3 n=1 Tax=Perna viridis TaxID=73031 RepID=U5Y413_PERVI